MMNRHIEILGCSASGKTTLCNTLSRLGLNAIYEPYLQNPFLLKYFSGEQCAFELQVCFLLQHYNSLKSTELRNMSICDYSFALDEIYASLLLTEQEKCVYDYVYKHILESTCKPHCIIKLICPDDIIVNRMQMRNRNYESEMDITFLSKLNQAVRDFSTENYCIEIDSSKVDVSCVDEVKNHLLPYIPLV